MGQRYLLMTGTIRNVVGPNTFDIPSFVRLDTKTGQAWVLEIIPGAGMQWVGVGERGPLPAHD